MQIKLSLASLVQLNFGLSRYLSRYLNRSLVGLSQLTYTKTSV